MKNTLKSKMFVGLFIALALALTPVLSTATTAAVPSHLSNPTAFYAKLAQWPGANVDWYLADPDAAEFSISTPAELFGMAFLVNTEIELTPNGGFVQTVTFEGKTVKLTADIDLSTVNSDYTSSTATYGELWAPMGWGAWDESSIPNSPGEAAFWGTFDGNGFTVSGLANKSLFGMVKSATIKNLLTSGTLTTTGTGSSRIAGVANEAKNSTFINLKSDAHLVFSAISTLPVGGIVSAVVGNTTIDNCEFSGTFTTTTNQQSLGGIVGQVGVGVNGGAYFTTTNLTVSNSVNRADLSSRFNIGGIVGATEYTYTANLAIPSISIVIQDSVNYGNISASLDNAGDRYGVGGLVGASYYSNAGTPQSLTIENSANYGNVTGGINTGGLVGTVYQGNQLNITNSYNQGNVTSTRVGGGIVGRIVNADGAVIKNTYDTGTVSGANSGGFAGIISAGAVDSVNNYYLDTAAPGAVNSAPYTGVTALTAAQMKDPSFASMLGDGYVMGEDGYPILAWQSIEPVDKT